MNQINMKDFTTADWKKLGKLLNDPRVQRLIDGYGLMELGDDLIPIGINTSSGFLYIALECGPSPVIDMYGDIQLIFDDPIAGSNSYTSVQEIDDRVAEIKEEDVYSDELYLFEDARALFEKWEAHDET